MIFPRPPHRSRPVGVFPMRSHPPSFRTGRGRRLRRGSVLGLMAFILPVLAILSAFCINLAHIQTTRTELMVATDAAARAAGRTLSETQSLDDARLAAVSIAAMNQVGGEPLMLDGVDGAGEVEFGHTVQKDGLEGRYTFESVPTADIQAGVTHASAVRILGRRTDGSLSGHVDMAIPGLLSLQEFETSQDAVAMQVDRDISLVLDRSGSMTDAPWEWPSGTSPWRTGHYEAAVDAGVLRKNNGYYYYRGNNNSYTFQSFVWTEQYGFENPPNNLWMDLNIAVAEFINVLGDTIQDEQVSMATYATGASLDTYLSKDFRRLLQKLDRKKPEGATAIGEGMIKGMDTLNDRAARTHAAKTMVVMTDGRHNRGVDPVTKARDFMRDYNLKIHTVTFGDAADITRMREVARIGGGRHYHAETGPQLVAIFREIANNLPTILTD